MSAKVAAMAKIVGKANSRSGVKVEPCAQREGASKPSVKREQKVKDEPRIKVKKEREVANSAEVAPQGRILQEVVSMLRHGMGEDQVCLS